VSKRTQSSTRNPSKSFGRYDFNRHGATAPLNCHAGGREFKSRPLRQLRKRSREVNASRDFAFSGTKTLAKRWVQEIESRVARGTVGIDEPDDSPTFKVLFEQFAEGLTNRNAKDDRSRGIRPGTTCSTCRRAVALDRVDVSQWHDDGDVDKDDRDRPRATHRGEVGIGQHRGARLVALRRGRVSRRQARSAPDVRDLTATSAERLSVDRGTSLIGTRFWHSRDHEPSLREPPPSRSSDAHNVALWRATVEYDHPDPVVSCAAGVYTPGVVATRYSVTSPSQYCAAR
jgi:hypothetical protein